MHSLVVVSASEKVRSLTMLQRCTVMPHAANGPGWRFFIQNTSLNVTVSSLPPSDLQADPNFVKLGVKSC